MNNVRLENDRPKTGGLENDRTAGETAVAPMTTYCPYNRSGYMVHHSTILHFPPFLIVPFLNYVNCWFIFFATLLLINRLTEIVVANFLVLFIYFYCCVERFGQ